MYVIDTSAWLDIDGRPDANDVWILVDQLISKGRILVPRAVISELHENLLYDLRLKKHESVLLDSDKGDDIDFLLYVGVIANKYPGMSKARGTRTPADPFVIAFAEIHGCTVVCNEITTKRPNRKIPTVCKSRKIKCVNLDEFVRTERTLLKAAENQETSHLVRSSSPEISPK